jgi:hypothetical protein
VTKASFEWTSAGWFYQAKHGRVFIANSLDHVSAADLLLRAEIVDRASQITEQNIADAASMAPKGSQEQKGQKK